MHDLEERSVEYLQMITGAKYVAEDCIRPLKTRPKIVFCAIGMPTGPFTRPLSKISE